MGLPGSMLHNAGKSGCTSGILLFPARETRWGWDGGLFRQCFASLGEEQRGQTVIAPSIFECGPPQSLWSRWVLQPHPCVL